MSEKVQIGLISAIASVLVAVITTIGVASPIIRDIITREKPKLVEDVRVAASTSGVPIGTVAASMLDPERFSKMVGNGEDFSVVKSTWIPADGREVGGSLYARVLGRSRVPDLRGLFIRGLNTFEPGRDRLREDSNWADPDGNGRGPGEPQADSLKAHHHMSYGTNESGAASGPGGHYVTDVAKTATTSDEGAAETRPKNAALFYYIKIN